MSAGADRPGGDDTPRFEADREIEEKLLATVAPGGYLRCIAD